MSYLQLNKTVFENLDESARVDLEGYRAGVYVRMEFAEFPATFVEHFNPRLPYIVGGVLPGEQNMGYVQVSVYDNKL